jgi:hypothetical protein
MAAGTLSSAKKKTDLSPKLKVRRAALRRFGILNVGLWTEARCGLQ